MRLVFAGTPAVAVPSLQRLLESEHEVLAVVTRPDAAKGRSKRLTPSEVGEFAAAQGLEVLKPAKASDPEFLARLTELAPDAGVVVAYGGLLPQRVLDVPPHGWINLHFSLLPRWRGAAPVQHTLIAGDAVAGAATFRLVQELDAGAVHRTLTRPLDGTETSGELLAELAESGAGLLLDTVAGLGVVEPTPQPTEGVTLAPKITVADAHLDLSRPADELDRLIRGCSPEPMAWTALGGERLKIALARPTAEDTLAPGHVRIEKRRVLVGTGSTDLELLQVQPQGKKVMDAAAWGRGLRADVLVLGAEDDSAGAPGPSVAPRDA